MTELGRERRERNDFLRMTHTYKPIHFQGYAGARVQYQHRREQVEARSERRYRLARLLGESLRWRAAGAVYGSASPYRYALGVVPRGPTQAQLAKELGVSRSTISRDLKAFQVEVMQYTAADKFRREGGSGDLRR